jgi:hypothetical protein
MPRLSTSTNTDSVQFQEQASAPSTPSSGYVQDFARAGAKAHTDDGGLTQTATGVMFTQTTATAVEATASETTLLSAAVTFETKTLPANTLIAGRTLRIRASGHYSTKASTAGNLNLLIYLGSTAIVSTGDFAVTDNLTGRGWKLDVEITCYTTGASGTVWAQGIAMLFTAAGTIVHREMVKTATVTVDTTASQAVDVRADWQTSDASNSITCTNATIEILF